MSEAQLIFVEGKKEMVRHIKVKLSHRGEFYCIEDIVKGGKIGTPPTS